MPGYIFRIKWPARLISIKAARAFVADDFENEEEDMPLTNAIYGIFGKISERLAARRRLADFTCGDCERLHRCNLSPSSNCIARQEQIARGDWKARRVARALLYESRWI
jgi:hypothetical protein